MAFPASEPAQPFSPLEKLELAAEVLAAYCRVRWLLWRRDLPATLEAIRDRDDGQWGASRRSDCVDGERLGRVVTRTLAPLPTDSRCLVRSLTLSALLARRGIDSSLVIAVRSRPEFAAHAWVECAGRPLLPTGEAAYQRLLEM